MRKRNILASCGARLTSWNSLRSHETYCPECLSIKHRAERLRQRQSGNRLEAAIDAILTQEEHGRWAMRLPEGEGRDSTLYRLGRNRNRLLRVLWRLPGAFSLEAWQKITKDRERVAPDPPVCSLRYVNAPCEFCGMRHTGTRCWSVPRTVKVMSCRESACETLARTRVFTALRRKYPETTFIEER